MELAATREVLLATGRPRRVSLRRILGKSVFWWMDRLSILRASRETRVGKYLMKTDPFPGNALGLGRLRRQGIRVVGRLTHANGKRVGFAGVGCDAAYVMDRIAEQLSGAREDIRDRDRFDPPNASRRPARRSPLRSGVE